LPDIIVCLKQVYDETEIRIDRPNNRIIVEGAKTKISDDDKNAIEEAVRLKEKNGGSVTAVCLGSSDVKKSAKEALAMGCDKVRLLVDPLFSESDALNTAFILSKAISKIGKFDVVITATSTTDTMSAIVGPSLSEYLGIPLLSFVTKLSLSGNKISADSSYEEGVTTVEAELPALVTVLREINQPRFPTLLQIMSAGKKEMIEWNSQALGLDQSSVGKNGSNLEVKSLSVPQSARKKVLFEGKPEDTSKQLADVLIREGVVK
jgi:electron transfer flavoprotein beta subunit